MQHNPLPPINFRALADALLPMSCELLADWMPRGKKIGREWVDGALSCNIFNGRWGAFNSGAAGRDLVSLYAHIYNLTPARAARDLAGRYGLLDVAGIAGGRGLKPSTEEERQKMHEENERKRLEAEEKQEAEYRAMAAECRRLWSNGKPCNTHPYLERKGVKAYGELRTMSNGTLMIPMLLRGVISSIQFIKADGTKNFKGGARSSGAYCKIGFEMTDAIRLAVLRGQVAASLEQTNNQADLIVICEGYATAASIHEATGLPVVVCFSSGNIKNVFPVVRRHFEHAYIVIAADDDWQKNKAGETAAKAAIDGDISADYVLPEFGDARADETAYGRSTTDFNDLHRVLGLDAVKRAFSKYYE